MKILITGAHGFLGSHIKSYWEKLGHKAISVGRSDKNQIQCDLSQNKPKINQSIDFVIHAAGKAHIVPKNESEKNEFYKINVEGTKNLLDALALLHPKPKGILFVSSASVYGKQIGIDIDEDSNLEAQDPYGKSKVMAEEMVYNWGKHHGITAAIIRPPLIVGKNAPGNLKAMIDAIKSGKYRNIGKGNAKRSMVLAEDIAAFTPVLLERGGIYNLTDTIDPSFKELANEIGKKIDKKIYKLPTPIAKLIAVIGDLAGWILQREMPFSSNKLEKMTNSLTLDSSRAMGIGWQPKSILKHPELWL